MMEREMRKWQVVRDRGKKSGDKERDNIATKMFV
jgi:hypothetical protein